MGLVTFDAQAVRDWLADAATELTRAREEITGLDAAAGDGDHGVNMCRGFAAAATALETHPDASPGTLLDVAGKTLASTTGGASGALWGTALRRAGRALAETPAATTADLATAIEAMAGAVASLGGAGEGDKTMLDALAPAARALRVSADAGDTPGKAVAAASQAAAEGAEATRTMRAAHGRASYLGERSVGCLDAGAVSAALVIGSLARALGARAEAR